MEADEARAIRDFVRKEMAGAQQGQQITFPPITLPAPRVEVTQQPPDLAPIAEALAPLGAVFAPLRALLESAQTPAPVTVTVDMTPVALALDRLTAALAQLLAREPRQIRITSDDGTITTVEG